MVRAEFRITGFYSYAGWKTELEVRVSIENQDNFYLRTARDTKLAKVVEKAIIRKKFLSSGKRVYRKTLSEKQWLLLKALKEAGSKYWHLYEKFLREGMTQKELEAQILWRVL